MTWAAALRTALAPACVVLAVLLHLLAAGPYLRPTGLFLIAVIALAVGWGATQRARAEAALRRSERELLEARSELESKVAERTAALQLSEERYALAMQASGEGHWDWMVSTDEYYTSARHLEIAGFPPDTKFNGRADVVARYPFHPEDKPKYEAAAANHFAGKTPRLDIEVRILVNGELRWVHAIGMCLRDAAGNVVRWAGSVTDVTERKRTEEALRVSEERYALVMKASGAGHFDWKIQSDEFYVSPRQLEILGVAPDATWRTREEFIALLKGAPEDKQRYDAALAEHFAGKTDRFEMEILQRPRREPRWLRFTGVCLRDPSGTPVRWAGSTIDITERKQAAEALAESEARFRTLTEVSSDWYWKQDEHLRFTYMSDQAAALSALPAQSPIGKTRWELPDLTPLSCSWDEHRAVLAARQPFRDLELSRVLPDGSVGYFSVNGAPMFDEHGNFQGYHGSGRSITELKRLEQKLRQAQRLEAMGTLAGGIAHDFNNILGAILGYGEMALRDAAKGSRLRRDLDSIITAGERGRALVERILAFSRSGVGERVAVHVEKVVREALDLLSAKLPPNVTLHAKLHAGPAAMLGDATQVHQVLMNLAINAIQAMPAGGTLRVSLDAARIEAARVPTIGTLAAADYLVLQVGDTGAGIAPEIIERIFDPFFTTKEVGTGTGLGLSLVHGIVIELDGAIDVSSTPGKGSTFAVYLPRSGEVVELDESKQAAMPRGDGQRILIVDDEEPLVRLATRTLEELGYVPTGFTSSAAALAAFRADPQRFDAVITDERMPGMSGSALIREMRGIRDSIPVVLMSGHLGAAVGADEVLKKPLSALDLAASLARALQPH